MSNPAHDKVEQVVNAIHAAKIVPEGDSFIVIYGSLSEKDKLSISSGVCNLDRENTIGLLRHVADSIEAD